MSSPPSALGVTYCSRASRVKLFILFVELRDAYSARLNRASLLRLPLPRFCIHFGNYLTITSTSMSTSTSLLQATRQGKIAPGSMPPALALQAKVYWYENSCLPLPHISARPHRRWFGHLSYVAGKRGTTKRLSLALLPELPFDHVQVGIVRTAGCATTSRRIRGVSLVVVFGMYGVFNCDAKK